MIGFIFFFSLSFWCRAAKRKGDCKERHRCLRFISQADFIPIGFSLCRAEFDESAHLSVLISVHKLALRSTSDWILLPTTIFIHVIVPLIWAFPLLWLLTGPSAPFAGFWLRKSCSSSRIISTVLQAGIRWRSHPHSGIWCCSWLWVFKRGKRQWRSSTCWKTGPSTRGACYCPDWQISRVRSYLLWSRNSNLFFLCKMWEKFSLEI